MRGNLWRLTYAIQLLARCLLALYSGRARLSSRNRILHGRRLQDSRGKRLFTRCALAPLPQPRAGLAAGLRESERGAMRTRRSPRHRQKTLVPSRGDTRSHGFGGVMGGSRVRSPRVALSMDPAGLVAPAASEGWPLLARSGARWESSRNVFSAERHGIPVRLVRTSDAEARLPEAGVFIPRCVEARGRAMDAPEDLR